MNKYQEVRVLEGVKHDSTFTSVKKTFVLKA